MNHDAEVQEYVSRGLRLAKHWMQNTPAGDMEERNSAACVYAIGTVMKIICMQTGKSMEDLLSVIEELHANVDFEQFSFVFHPGRN